jgi:hypothetical protein
MERWRNDEDIGDAGSEHESMRSEFEKDGNCEDAEADTDERHGEHGETGEAEQRLVISQRKPTQEMSCLTWFLIFILFHICSYRMKLIHIILFLCRHVSQCGLSYIWNHLPFSQTLQHTEKVANFINYYSNTINTGLQKESILLLATQRRGSNI